MHSNKQNPVEVISAGDIGAGVGFKDIRTGDTLCDETAPIVLESIADGYLHLTDAGRGVAEKFMNVTCFHETACSCRG